MMYGLPDETLTRIQAVLSHFPEVEEAVIYGSRAKGNYKQGSDIDLALVGTDLDQRIISRIDEDLDDLLLPYRFDLSIFGKIDNAELIEHVRRVGVTFYSKTRAISG